jgi:hypothetical protein
MNAASNIEKALKELNRKVAPLWPLTHFVAVNPFAGFSDQRFGRVAAYLKRIQDSDLLMPRAWYGALYEAGDIGMHDIRVAVAGASKDVKKTFEISGLKLNETTLVERLGKPEMDEIPYFESCAFSIYLDRREGSHWQHVLREEVAKWCAAYDDAGQSSWKFPWQGESLYDGWKAAAVLDRNAELQGIEGFRQQVALLPDDCDAAIEEAIQLLGVPGERLETMLYQLLLTLPGWSGHLRYKDREHELRGGEGTLLKELLAILLNYERILFQNHASDKDCMLGWKRALDEDWQAINVAEVDLELVERLVWQAALENVFESRLSNEIRPSAPTSVDRPDVQAVFCIDVRSEVFRRALEATELPVQTLGFAGFFGLPINHKVPMFGKSQARCPVILAPPLQTAQRAGDLAVPEMESFIFESIDARESARAEKRYKEGAASCFTFVETFGLGYLVKLIKASFGLGKSAEKDAELPGFLELPDLQASTDLAQGILKGLGLNKTFAKVILLCGHGCETQNNPYASGLDCGACGGHAGDANARIAAALLNRVDVRAELAKRGAIVPADTRFIGGLHNTTTDEVTLFDTEGAEAGVIKNLRKALKAAGAQTALERSLKLDLSGSSEHILAGVQARSQDWSQVRPEWGLAGNAAFVVAPRPWTAGADLQGRAFLHDYDAANDPEAAVLEQIVGGPLVVTSWINLQYYASSVDNTHFGSGHKSIHNVVGGVGVAIGNESDLRPGLAWQSVHDGNKLVHQPLRLHVCIAAEPEVLDGILSRQQHVRELVENGWVHLIAMGADGRLWAKRGATGAWLERKETGVEV